MIEYVLPNNPDEPLWAKYASEGYAVGTGDKGFRVFVQNQVPRAIVSGTTGTGLRLLFCDDKDFTAFVMKWSS